MKILTSLFCLVLMCCLAIIQQSLLPNLLFNQWSLNLVLIAVFFLSSQENKGRLGFLACFLGGFFLYFFSAWPWGLLTVSLTITALITNRFSRLIQKNSLLALWPLFLVSFLTYQLASLAIMIFLGEFYFRFRIFFTALAANLAAISLFFALLQALGKNRHRYDYF